MYTKLGRKNKRKMDRADDALFDLMSDDSLLIYKKFDYQFKLNLD